MQLNWRASFTHRVLFNASEAYVMQLPRGDKYESLQPVYSLNLMNDIFELDMEEYYHYYRLVHYLHSNKVLEGLHLVFVELPKFKAKNLTEKKMQVLWRRFLTEIGEATKTAPRELVEDPHVNQAPTKSIKDYDPSSAQGVAILCRRNHRTRAFSLRVKGIVESATLWGVVVLLSAKPPPTTWI